ncbi:MAG: glycoside hydrolase family 78 protein [Tannerella sp.]|jgi:alpha-L-rhamnosidase|nr:glycoside hydrolase family 78 protein [Tannerella sp.]
MNILCLIAIFCATSYAVEPQSLTCEYVTNPVGIDIAQPMLGWKLLSDERNQYQTAYELMVALSEKDLAQEKNLVWKSGKIHDSQIFNIPYGGKRLRPFTRYYWKVKVYDRNDKASAWSAPAYWETAMLSPSDWRAQWIGDGSVAPVNEADFYRDDPAPAFRKVFHVKKPLAQARLYITGLGYYEASLNGQAVSDRRLDPGWTNYGKQILYSAFDVTSLLRDGENAVGVLLGNGFYNPLPMRIFRLLRENLYIGRPCFTAQIRLTYADGSEEWIVTDGNWKAGASPILRNNVYLGELYDARNEIAGWDQAGFDDSRWSPSVPVKAPAGRLTAQMQPPIRVTKVLHPVRMTETRPGEYIFDMGQNMAGVARIKVRGPKGTQIRIRYGEDIYSDGSLNVMTSVAGQQKRVWDADLSIIGQPPVAWQEDRYILKGDGEEMWSPRFTFHGFRYVEITGWPGGRPTLNDVEALRLNADLPRAGRFDCSSELLTQLHTVVDNTFLSNVFSLQSDCPAREKFGYGGDIVGTARTFCWFYDMGNFYRKVICDFANDQRPLGGITETAPYNGIADQGLGDESGPIGWQLAFAFLQKQLYEYYGDIRIIQACYPALRKQVEFLRSKAEGHFIDRCINDHESLETRIPELFATAHYYHHVILLAEFAQLTNHAEDAKTYTQLAGEIKSAFIRRFVPPGSGEAGNHTQATQAFALFYDLLPEGDRNAAFNVLLQEIEKRDGHIACGIFGVPLVLDALSRNHRNDIACEMVTKKDFPGWGHMLQSGATTMWETWQYSDNVYSHNHPMFGSVGEWLYQSVLGINIGSPGFRKIILHPQPAGDLTWASGSYESLWGTITSSWKLEDNRFTYDITVPAGATAEVWLPSGAITESGRPLDNADDVSLLWETQNYAIYKVGSGKYNFLSELRVKK